MKTVIFDIGYVLVHYDWDEYLHSLFSDEHTIAVVKDALYNHGVWNELDRGVWTEEQLKAGFVAPAPDYEKEILEASVRPSDSQIRLPRFASIRVLLMSHSYSPKNRFWVFK